MKYGDSRGWTGTLGWFIGSEREEGFVMRVIKGECVLFGGVRFLFVSVFFFRFLWKGAWERRNELMHSNEELFVRW